MRTYPAACFLWFTIISSHAYGNVFNQAFIGNDGNIHLVDASGKSKSVPSHRKAFDLKLSSNKENVAWLIKQLMPPAQPNEVEVPEASELVIYRHSKTRSIVCPMLIRNYWFTKNGKFVAIDCGPRHFAGHEELYDLETLRLVDSFDQAEVPDDKRPPWSNEQY